MLGVCVKYTQNNYGSKLQALATVELIREYGGDYEIIRYNKKTLSFYLRAIPRLFNTVFLSDRLEGLQKKLGYMRHPEINQLARARNSAFESFDYHFNNELSIVYPSYSDLKKQCGEHYSKVLTCSDQLWSPAALASGFYNLMFVPKDVPKVSLASSFGVRNIPWYQKRRTKKYLSRIEHISVRETRGAEIVSELTGRKVPVLSDPVFAYTKEEWERLVPIESLPWDDYILCYFLGADPKHRTAARKLAQKTGKKLLVLRHLDRFVPTDESFGDIAPYDVSPDLFLNIVRNASFVCTDSFHGTAFSIICERPFAVFNRYKDASVNSKNSRIDSLCETFDLWDRRCLTEDDILKICELPCDFCKTKDKAMSFRRDIREYLKNTL